jgi:hypothetical protein
MVSGIYNTHIWADHMTALSRGAHVCALLILIKLYATFAIPRLLKLLHNNGETVCTSCIIGWVMAPIAVGEHTSVPCSNWENIIIFYTVL